MTVQYDAWSKYGISWCAKEMDDLNYTSEVCGNTTFGSLYMNEGSHHFKVYANNTLGVWNVSSPTIYFTMDNTNPIVSLTTPVNSTYSSNVSLTYTRYDANGISSCLYELNNANTTISGCLNTTLTGTSGTNKFKLWVNDSAGLWGVSSTVYFTVDTTPPAVSISLPANTTYTTENRTLTFTAWDANGITP
jgi:hypothetical protein